MRDEMLLLTALLEWGADEALDEAPVDRLAALGLARPVQTAPVPQGIAGRAASIATACEDLEVLRHRLQAFDGCPLRDTASQLVFASGPAEARLAFVMEAPSTEDDATGVPLSGRLGAFFDRMLASIGEARNAVRVVCLVPWRPPGDRQPSSLEIAACQPFLQAHLRLLPRLAYIVLLGGAVVKAVAGRIEPMRQLRGQWVEVAAGDRTVPALVMAPTSVVAGDARQKSAAWTDLLRLRRALDDAQSRSSEG